MMVDVFCTLPNAYSYRYPVCNGQDAPRTVDSVTSLINIASLTDITAVRAALINYIWSVSGLPTTSPTVELDVAEARLNSLPNLGQIDKYTFALPFSVTSYAWRMRPSSGALTRLLIYHCGHAESLDSSLAMGRYAQALGAGYDVISLQMPLHGDDNSDGSYLGVPFLTEHNNLTAPEADHDSLGYSALRLFVEPVIEVLNLLEDFGPIAMVGLSGGGWTTLLSAAIDPRILYSYPCSGVLPWFLRVGGELGDWEQQLGALYDIANYEDLYIMAACGTGRRQLEIHGANDNTFDGSKQAQYSAAIRKRAASLGGSWDCRLDDTYTTHLISPSGMAQVLWDLERQLR